MLDIEVVKRLKPDAKDLKRVDDFSFYKSGMRNWFYGNGAPIASNARKQAKLIKDPIKLVKRAKAVVQRWGTQDHFGYAAGQPIRENVWEHFEYALREAGFDFLAIQEIKNHRES